MIDAEAVWGAIADLAPSIKPVEALALGEAHWPEMKAREPNEFDAESCRLLALAAAEQEVPDYGLAEVWRTRALIRFTLIGWHEGVGTTVLGRAFAALSIENDGYPLRQKTLDVIRGSQVVIDILDEIVPLMDAVPSGIAVGTRSPDKELLARFYYAARGFFLLALGKLDEARESYGLAAQAARGGSRRGPVKVRLGLALVDYVAGLREAALSETRAAVDDARTLGPQHQDLVHLGEQNIAVMERGGSDLRPYEIL